MSLLANPIGTNQTSDNLDDVDSHSATESESPIFSGVLQAHESHGFDAGYRRGVADVLASMLALTEQYLRRHAPNDEGARKLLYGFELYVEQHLDRPQDAGYVADGLGI